MKIVSCPPQLSCGRKGGIYDQNEDNDRSSPVFESEASSQCLNQLLGDAITRAIRMTMQPQ